VSADPVSAAPTREQIGAYCRRVEAHLTRVNGGHLVRIVGPAFDLVRQWAESGVPFTVVARAIDMKAERHERGAATHPLRIEFCERDVMDIFAHWRRAVGIGADDGDPGAPGSTDAADSSETGSRRPPLGRHFERVVERLVRAVGRIEPASGPAEAGPSSGSDAIRDALQRALDEVVALRDEARGARGEARAAAESRLASIDARLSGDLRAAVPAAIRVQLEDQAAADLGPFRGRLTRNAWSSAIEATVDRLIRDRYGVPVVEVR
jgi:hypothetical protein